VGPHFGVSFDHAGTCRELDSTTRPADGHELLVLRRSRADDGADGYDAGRRKPVAKVVVGGRTTTLEELPIPGAELVVSVPKGTDARLTVTDEGRTQSLGLRTATRGPDAVPGYYVPRTVTVAKGRQQRSALFGVGAHRYRTTMSVDASEAKALLLPWDAAAGWAKPGRAWLAVYGLEVGLKGQEGRWDDRSDLAYNSLIAAYSTGAMTGPQVYLPFTLAPGVRPVRSFTDAVHGTQLLFDVPLAFAGGSLLATPPEVLGTGTLRAVHADTTVLRPMVIRLVRPEEQPAGSS
jgi:hypothetical protein